MGTEFTKYSTVADSSALIRGLKDLRNGTTGIVGLLFDNNIRFIGAGDYYGDHEDLEKINGIANYDNLYRSLLHSSMSGLHRFASIISCFIVFY
jgi:hypothetical protein